MIVKLISVKFPQIPRLAYPQDDGLHEAVESTKQVLRRDFGEITGTDRALDRLEQCILADALRTAKHQGMVDLHLRLLHPLRQPHDDVATVLLTEDLPDMVEPRLRICGAA